MRKSDLRAFVGLVGSFCSPVLATPLTLVCPHQDVLLNVEEALTPAQRVRGLMFRKALAKDGGMLFSYPKAARVAMWMKNTYIPLDIIFIDNSGAILAIYENAVPHSLARIGPVENVVHVLEVGGGTVKRHKITNKCILRLEK